MSNPGPTAVRPRRGGEGARWDGWGSGLSVGRRGDSLERE